MRVGGKIDHTRIRRRPSSSRNPERSRIAQSAFQTKEIAPKNLLPPQSPRIPTSTSGLKGRLNQPRA